jgi:hypothetical protein
MVFVQKGTREKMCSVLGGVIGHHRRSPILLGSEFGGLTIRKLAPDAARITAGRGFMDTDRKLVCPR